MSVNVIVHRKTHRWGRSVIVILSAMVVTLMALLAASTFNITGTGTPPAAAAAACAPRCPAYSLAKGKAQIRFYFSPRRLRHCVRHAQPPFRSVTCEGFNSWWAPGRWALYGVGRDLFGNDYPQAQLI
jgi:hypothetical protein